jgi:hypothetical protein
MHAGVVSAIEAKTQVDVGAAVNSKVSYAAFKCTTANAVRVHDRKCVLRKHRSTVSRYVRIIGDPEHFPNKLQEYYMLGPVTAAQKALLLCRTDMLPTALRMHRQKKAESPTCQCCRIGAAETLEHAVLLCPAHESLRKDMWDALDQGIPHVFPQRFMWTSWEMQQLLKSQPSQLLTAWKRFWAATTGMVVALQCKKWLASTWPDC